MNTHLQKIRQNILAEFGNSCERCISEISADKFIEKCAGVIFCPGASVPTAWWLEMKMNMTIRLERRDGQLQTKTLGDEVQKAIGQILSSRKNLQSRVNSIDECRDRGHIGIPPHLEKRRNASPHINQLIRKTQKDQRITVTIGSKLNLN